MKRLIYILVILLLVGSGGCQVAGVGLGFTRLHTKIGAAGKVDEYAPNVFVLLKGKEKEKDIRVKRAQVDWDLLWEHFDLWYNDSNDKSWENQKRHIESLVLLVARS